MRVRKALLLPYKDGKILIQDRSNHRPPPWGFFGGSIEDGESVEEALVREIEEELSVTISIADVEFLGQYDVEGEVPREYHVYLWKINIPESEFDLQEGKGMRFVDLEEGLELLSIEIDKKVLRDAFEKIDLPL